MTTTTQTTKATKSDKFGRDRDDYAVAQLVEAAIADEKFRQLADATEAEASSYRAQPELTGLAEHERDSDRYDRGVGSYCRRHNLHLSWEADGICGACEALYF